MCSSMTAFAQFANGFYRVQNNGSKRYLYVRDCTGEVSTLGADMGALELWSGLDNAVSDPGSVIYLQNMGGGVYDLTSQATGVHQLTGRYMSIAQQGDFCMVYNTGQYLYEVGTSDLDPDMGMVGAKTSGEMPGKSAYRLWITTPVSSQGDNYFGIKPTVQAGDKHYAPFYADFAYTPVHDVKTWYVSNVDKAHGIAVISPISGTVARSQAVIVECPTAQPTTNRVELTTAAGNSAQGNRLQGVFFDNGERSGVNHADRNPAIVPFDATTMRVLTTNDEGKLVYVNTDKTLPGYTMKVGKKWVDNVKCIPHNQSYLSVDADCPATLQVMTEAEYKAYMETLVTVVAEADMAINVQVGESTSELGSDIPVTGGRDRAMAEVSYQILHRSFMSDGSIRDGEPSEVQQVTLYGAYTAQVASLGTTVRPRTEVGQSQPKGILKGADGKNLRAESDQQDALKDCEVTATALSIYQQANEVTYGNVSLNVGETELTLSHEAQTRDLSKQVEASQTLTYTTGESKDGEVTVSYSVYQEAEGFTLSGSEVSVTLNESKTGRGTCQILISAQGEGGKNVDELIYVSQLGDPNFDDSIEAILAQSRGAKAYSIDGTLMTGNPNSWPQGIYIINKGK